jgi:phosphoglycolate phosphatase-like HAD superfamily hydrolase
MRIYIDFDDVLCETARYLSGLAHDLFGCKVPYESIAGFDLQQAFSLSDAEIAVMMEHVHRADVLADLMPTPGGVEALRWLEARGHELSIVTGRPAASHAGSRRWLRRHGLAHLALVHVDKYGRTMTDARDMDQPATLDRAAFEALRFDVAIDDSPVALDLLAPRRECQIIVYDRPWNHEYPQTANMLRAGSWPEIVDWFGGHP